MALRVPQQIFSCFPAVVASVSCGLAGVCFAAGAWHDTVGLPAIYTMDRDGSNICLLAKLPGMKWHGSPCWSHDGKMVAFDVTPVKTGWAQCRIFVIGVEGPFKGMVKDLGCGNVPTWSPDDKKIAYMINGGNPQGVEPGIWVMNADGTGRKRLGDNRICCMEMHTGRLPGDTKTTTLRRIISCGPCGMGIRPRWSPDGKKLVMSGLSVLDLNSETLTSVLPGGYRSVDGATWSPDSKRLAFIGAGNDVPELCIIDADGAKGSLRVLLRAEVKGIASWSPDGKQIVFALKEADGRRHLYAIHADLPGLPVLLDRQKEGVWNADPEWSPDGHKIVFSSDRIAHSPPPNRLAPTSSFDVILEWIMSGGKQ